MNGHESASVNDTLLVELGVLKSETASPFLLKNSLVGECRGERSSLLTESAIWWRKFRKATMSGCEGAVACGRG